jgi:hypothetical protein
VTIIAEKRNRWGLNKKSVTAGQKEIGGSGKI